MKDIKELALRVAKEMYWMQAPHQPDIIDFATRLIAAYTEGQEPVAWIAVGGATDLKGGVYSKLFWQQSNARNGWAREWKPLYSAPPEPAPQPAATTTPEEIVGYTVAPVVCAAPSSEEVREMVAKTPILVDQHGNDIYPPKVCNWITKAADMLERLAAENTRLYTDLGSQCCRNAELIGLLAARVPDGCVVVPREPTEAMCQYLCDCDDRHSELKGASAIYKAMIVAGEVKQP